MAIEYNNYGVQTMHYQMTTTNRSFLNMHYYLKDIGIQNNKFMLALIDADLQAIDPFDKMLSFQMKSKVTREVIYNYWYFIRECVRIPNSGGAVGGGAKYELHRGNLALGFCMLFNINTFLELPRQCYKTVSAVCWYLHEYNFGTSNSNIAFLNKVYADSKNNLQLLKDIRDALPEYLRMNTIYNQDGKQLKTREGTEALKNSRNGNRILTVASAKSKINAANVLRGRSISNIWCDEFAFIPYNMTVYTNFVPAFNTAANIAKRNGTHYGLLITTTPGLLTDDSGAAAYAFRNAATPFNENWYDLSLPELRERLACNTNSSFVHIRYTYQQIGHDEAWFKNICILMQNKWADIRREVLLEWAEASDNCPFRKEDLEVIRVLTRDPIAKIPVLGGKYEINLYERADIQRFPPIIGVDVSGGFNRDSSAVTIIDSQTTRVIGDFNCNYIGPSDLASLIYELVTRYMPNAVVNIERNGGFGASVIETLIKTKIKRNLFYEIKDKVFEESFTISGRSQKTTKRVKVYGMDSTQATREILMDILRQRVDHHKDKFISKIIFEEMLHMEVKKNGRVEHSSNSHDDQVFSYLWALYVWYEGKDVLQTWGINKSTLKTDADLEESVITIDEQYKSILEEAQEELDEMVTEQLKSLNPNKVMTYSQWVTEEYNKDQEALNRLLTNKVARQAYDNKYNMDTGTPLNGLVNVPDDIFGEDIPEDFAKRFNMYQMRK